MDPADAGRHSGHHRTRPYDQCYYLTFSLVKIMHLGPHAWQSVVIHLKLCLCTKAEMLHFFFCQTYETALMRGLPLYKSITINGHVCTSLVPSLSVKDCKHS